VLEEHGFEVAVFSDPAEGFKGILSRLPDLVLLDVQMPGMSGFDLCRRLKQNLATAFIPVIFLSGRMTDAGSKVEGFSIGGDDYLTKPFEVDELLARVGRSLRGLAAVRPRTASTAFAKPAPVPPAGPRE
jgi:DNA-binding response OmpR family regulator